MDFRPHLKIILLSFLMAMPYASGRERYEFFNGVRSLGMGGTQVAVVNDETALLGNPAALGRLRDYFLTIADPELEIGQDTQSLVDLDITKFLDPQDVLDSLNSKPKNRFYERAQLFPSFVITNFGFGFYGNYLTNATLNDAATELDLFYRNDFAFVFGLNFRLFDGRIKFGLNARAINRVEIDDQNIDATRTDLSINNLASEGFGVASDIGLIMTAPWQWLPTLAAVYRDFGNTSYTQGDGYFIDAATKPNVTKGSLDAGFSVQPIIGKGNRLTISAELKDVLANVEPEDEDAVSRRMHYGLEFNFKDVFFLRGGMNQGYWTAGMELAVMSYQLQFATYGEEVGTKITEAEDRRYVGKFSWRF